MTFAIGQQVRALLGNVPRSGEIDSLDGKHARVRLYKPAILQTIPTSTCGAGA